MAIRRLIDHTKAKIHRAHILGVKGCVAYELAKNRLRTSSDPGTEVLHTKLAKHGLLCRRGGSDIEVFRQIFMAKEYSSLDDLKDVDLIIDCGAYVGYSGSYFLNRFPNSHLIAVEADSDNFSILQKNLAPYGDRAQAVHAGIWSHQTNLVMSEETFRDGHKWSMQVREAPEGEANSFKAIDIGTLLQQSGRERISLLKMDIEGAEGMVFSRGYESWIDKVDNIAIELHDDSCFGPCSEIFHTAIASQNFAITVFDEVTVCKRKS